MRGRIHHVDLTVKDPEASFAFYDAVLGFMGYQCVSDHARGYDWDIGDRDADFCSIGVMKAEGTGAKRTHDRYSPGLHHLAWTAASRDDVDALHRLLVAIGAKVLDPPMDYPRYGPGYYAVFFADPDGLKLEYVHWPADDQGEI